MIKKTALFIILLMLSSACAVGTAHSASNGGGSFAPWDFNRGKSTSPYSVSLKESSPTAYFLKKSIRFFIDYISPVDGDRCPMYPTCSSYGLQATERHGFIIGFIMTADRLIHESDEMTYAPLVEVCGSVRYIDTLDNNDFWWYSKGPP
ncbi:MAG: membrane protein insertion efficiency factor YidD [Deltaproteobacteria bacterium]|nr:membrane protein insertion efficiency factor YidD [Deltaproteobacteria bacterium]